MSTYINHNNAGSFRHMPLLPLSIIQEYLDDNNINNLLDTCKSLNEMKPQLLYLLNLPSDDSLKYLKNNTFRAKILI